MYELINTNVVNANDSFRGDFIKQWVEFHIKDVHSKYHEAAEIIYNKYWNNDTTFPPKENVFYWVLTSRFPDLPLTHSTAKMSRDIVKSPKPNIFNRYESYNTQSLRG